MLQLPLTMSSASPLITWLDPQPLPDERPPRLPNPFDDVAPHALAQRCAQVVMADLGTGFIAPGLPTSVLSRAEGGKMFGVLVVHDEAGRVGFLRAVSGQVERIHQVPGYVPPVFDVALREAVEPQAEVVVKHFTARVEAARGEPALHAARAALAGVEAKHAQLRDELRAKHAANKQARKAARVGTTDPRRCSRPSSAGSRPSSGCGASSRASRCGASGTATC